MGVEPQVCWADAFKRFPPQEAGCPLSAAGIENCEPMSGHLAKISQTKEARLGRQAENLLVSEERACRSIGECAPSLRLQALDLGNRHARNGDEGYEKFLNIGASTAIKKFGGRAY
ncbi:hypothetical protein [Ensifer sp. 4252]|uniref:hypothetical protein n=1 Tax=Ensifer sp. 4252 TaxID=3373915 RepID=UPI003D1F7288